MRLVLVEDDHLQRQEMKNAVLEAFPHASIREIATEHEFRTALTDLAAQPPDAVVIDVMLRWTDPSPHLPEPPPEVQQEKFYRAGVRCAWLIHGDERLRSVPTLLFTMIDESDLAGTEPPAVELMTKREGTDGLIAWLKSRVPPARQGGPEDS